MKRIFTALLFMIVFKVLLYAQDPLAFKEIVYGHQEGVALVMNMVKPSKANGIAVVRLISNGWKSFVPDSAYISKIRAFTEKGQTVFLVSHGSQPRYKVSEILDQVKLAVQFVKNNADRYGIDPDRIGITGVSSGGHLSLMTAFSASKINISHLTDNVKSGSVKIGAVGCFCPPSNLMEFGCPDSNIFHSRVGRVISPNAFNVTKKTQTIDQNKELKMLSPVYLIGCDSPPTIIVHGDKDNLVPITQSENFINTLREYNVPCKLVVKKGAGHTWVAMDDDNAIIAEWFEKYLSIKN
ncbi:MAG: prolyl oligopeptidase family serine peptidase [Mangrovibacterium sp.]